MIHDEPERDYDAEMRNALRVARHQHLVLVVAARSGDTDGAASALRRLESQLAVAHLLLDAIGPTAHAAWTDRLEKIHAAAEPWLFARHRPEMTSADIARLAARAPATAADQEPRIVADGLALKEMDWTELQLPRISAVRSELVEIWAQRATLDGGELSWSTLRNCHLDGSSAQQTSLWKTTLEDTHLNDANLVNSTLTGLTATSSHFHAANLWNTWLDGAAFITCELQGAVLGAASFRGANGARFLWCDLRYTDWRGRRLVGVTIDGCKLYGSRGDASAAMEAEFLRPDLSPAGDGSQIGTHADVIAMWRAADAARGAAPIKGSDDK